MVPDSYEQDLYYSLSNIQITGVVNPLIQLENEYDKTKDGRGQDGGR